MNPLDLDPKFVTEVAVGLEPPDDIAHRYGIDPSIWERMKSNPSFRAAVGAKLAELQRGGVTAKLKAALLTEKLMEELYRQAQDPEVSLSGKLQVAQWMGKIGDLEPKENLRGSSVGAGFQLTIVMPDGANAGQMLTIEGTATPSPPPPPSLIVDDAPPALPLDA